MATPSEKFKRLLKSNRIYDAEAYNFLCEALDYTVKNVISRDEGNIYGEHVSASELLEGIRKYAIEEFGCLSGMVFNEWGIRRTEDFGRIVFNLVEHDLFLLRGEDKIEDFSNAYDVDVFDVVPCFDSKGDIFYVSREKAEILRMLREALYKRKRD